MIADPGLIRAQHEAAYDALAELFLGELAPVSARDAAVGVQPAHRTDAPAHAVGPATPSRSVPPLHLVSGDSCDEDAPPPGDGGPALAPPVQVEALVLGHLPVMAGAWAGQYVRHVAASSVVPVAHVRLCAGRVRIELVEGAAGGSGGSAARPHTFVAAGTLADAAAILRQRGARLVMHVDGEHELTLAQTCAVGRGQRVTMLTSADEAGVVGAYRTIKSLAARVEAAQALTDSTVVNVVIMGAPEPRARYVWRRLQEAAETFLGVELALAARIERIGPGRAGGVVYEGDCPHGGAELVSLLTTGPALARPGETEPLPSSQESRTAAARAIEHAAPTVAANPPITSHPPPQVAHVAIPVSLAACLPGLTSMQARCPHAEDVELAIDRAGALHLLARYRAHEPDARVVERLHAAGCWAALHRRVLSLTVPGALFDAAAPVRHLFTDRPAEHRALFDSDVRMHLLVPVKPDAAVPWVCAPVN